MAEYFTILTDTGKDKVAAAMSGGPALRLAQMAVGDGGGPGFYDQYDRDTLKGRNTLVNQQWIEDLNLVDQDPQNPAWVITEGLIPTHVGGWYIREVGIFDLAGDLIAIGVYPETYKPVATAVEADLLVRSILEVGDAESVELKIDPSQVMATRAWVVDVAIPRALTMLDDKVEVASGHADRAEIARDAAQTASGIFSSVEAGEGSASIGEHFWVTSENDAESLILYKRESQGSVEVKRYPAATESITQGWRGALDAGLGVERRVGDNPHSYTQSLTGGGPENRPSLGISERSVGSTGSTFRLDAPGILARREMVNIRTNPVVLRVDILTGNPASVSEEWDGEYRAGVAWYRSNRSSLEDDPISLWKVDAGAGQTNFYEDSFTFGPSGSGADLEAPSGAVYAIPFFEVTGTKGAFFASRLEVRDNSVVENIAALKKSAKVAESEAQPGASVVNLFRDGSQGEAFDFTNPLLYSEAPMVGGAFPGARSMVGPGELRTVSGREVRIERHGGRLVTSQPLGSTERLPLISDEPLLMQWPCTLVFSVKADAQQSGRLPVFWQHGDGEEGRVQITLNARLGSGVLTDNDRLQVFIAGITDGKGINEMPLQAETPRGTATVVALVMREGKGASEFWANGRLVDTFTAPPVIYQTTSYLLGHPSILGQQHGCYYGRILTINRALPMHELEQACEWAAAAFGETWHQRPLHNRDLLNATAALTLLAPTSGAPENPGHYRTIKTLYAKNADQVLKPASVTKVMTAMIMLDHIDDLQDTIQMQEGDQTSGSGNNLQVGDIISYEDALYNMMLPSSNVTTTIISRIIGQKISDQEGDGEPVEMFIKAMNRKARDLGMSSTYFTNASGLNNDAMVTTARDLGRLGIAALSYPEIITTWGKPTHTIEVQGENARSVNIKHSINMINDDDIMGGKTGTLTGNNLTRNLLALSKMPGGNFAVSIIMLTSSDNRYTDMRKLLEFVKESYRWPASYLFSM